MNILSINWSRMEHILSVKLLEFAEKGIKNKKMEIVSLFVNNC